MHYSRRQFLLASSVAAVAWTARPRWGTAEGASSSHFVIEDIKRTTVSVPYRDVPARNMARELPHWTYSEIFEVRLKSGKTGIGETLLYYTWGATQDDDVERAQGQNALNLLWDDRLGAGLQMALFDAVARTADVPVHRLLGRKVNERTPLSWWNIDTSPEDMVLECKEAMKLGYMSYKTKGRPWFDLWEQVGQSTAAVPPEFKIDMDYNDTLLDADRAIPILTELEKHPQIDIYETPIPQRDIQGNKRICEATRVGVAMHYGSPDPLVAIREDICDGFVIGGGARRLMETAAVLEMADKRFWLQLVGTGLTAAYCLHFGGVMTHATWPAVNCHQLYVHDLLTEPVKLENGSAAVPDRPGIGYELDQDAVRKFACEKPAKRPDPPRLIETSWPDGRKMYIANTGEVNFMLTLGQRGEIPYFERGVTTTLVPDDESAAWRELYEQARHKPVMRS